MVEEEKIEVEEDKPVEKIGFNTPLENSSDGTPSYKKKIKFSNQRKSKLQKASFGVLIPAMILSIATLSFFFMPILSGLAGIIATLIIGIIIVIPVLATVFLILMSDGYRQFVGKAWKIVEWFFDATNHIVELSPYYPFVAFPAIAFDIAEIVLCIITIRKNEKGVITYLIVTSIMLLFIIVLTFIYYVNGRVVFNG